MAQQDANAVYQGLEYNPIWDTCRMMDNAMPHVHLIDVSGVLHRAYHSCASRIPDDGSEEFTSAFYNRILVDFYTLRKYARGSQRGICAWDNPRDNSEVRRAYYPAYKMNRKDDSASLFIKNADTQKNLGEILSYFGFAQISSDYGFEADDMIAALTYHFHENGHNVHIHTRDKDLRQLVFMPNVNVCNIWDSIYINRNNFESIFMFKPEYMALYLSLRGDAADNIAGVQGVGEKRALEFIDRLAKSGVAPNDFDGIARVAEEGAAKFLVNIKQAAVSGELENLYRICRLSAVPSYTKRFNEMDTTLKGGDWQALDSVSRHFNCSYFRNNYLSPVLEALAKRDTSVGAYSPSY